MAQKPDFETGVNYWANTEASVNGVLGGYGEGTPVPRLDATSSRLLILALMPYLSTIIPPHSTSTTTPRPNRPFRALDCGAGIGRVTSTVLLPLFDSVDLVEPVPSFVKQAKRDAVKGKEGWINLHPRKDEDGEAQQIKNVRIWRAGLQHFNPLSSAVPVPTSTTSNPSVELFAELGNVGFTFPNPEEELDPTEEGYDLIMIQWCIGHLSDEELADFLRRSQKALRRNKEGKVEGYIIVKENTCKDTEMDGRLFDDEDSSITRSDSAFRTVFKQAGLRLLRREVQQGFPKELFPVVAYALQ
ncbi:N-terminal protein methyltransferase [Sporobolomyces salmoneus]|uniref:N-terminal protein methyltransferase n=1 Tax=Sporobolomyces salmoneus TaxID=183962 RepID=UPI0031752450